MIFLPMEILEKKHALDRPNMFAIVARDHSIDNEFSHEDSKKRIHNQDDYYLLNLVEYSSHDLDLNLLDHRERLDEQRENPTEHHPEIPI